MSLEPLIQIVAEAIDVEAFRVAEETHERELRRRSARARAKAAVRIAQALGWRFSAPGDFDILGEDQLDAHCDRAKANLKEAGDLLERP